jgi:hypothetical protein
MHKTCPLQCKGHSSFALCYKRIIDSSFWPKLECKSFPKRKLSFAGLKITPFELYLNTSREEKVTISSQA